MGDHCSIQCLKSALPRSASMRNALKRLVSQPQREVSRPLPGAKFLHLTTDTTGGSVQSTAIQRRRANM
jgi:hypothetical protein